jgi:hypothetical protein
MSAIVLSFKTARALDGGGHFFYLLTPRASGFASTGRR